MRIGNWITTRVNRVEAWIECRSRSIWRSPVRLAAYVLLFVLLLITNLIALVRWPFSALARLIASTRPVPRGCPIPVDGKELSTMLNEKDLVLVDFWAEWCGPCVMMGGLLKDFARSYEERVTVAKVDATLHPIVASEYNVKGLPTILLFSNGSEVDRHVGSLGYDGLVALIEQSSKEV